MEFGTLAPIHGSPPSAFPLLLFPMHKRALITFMGAWRYDRVEKGRPVVFIRPVKSILEFELPGRFAGATRAMARAFYELLALSRT